MTWLRCQSILLQCKFLRRRSDCVCVGKDRKAARELQNGSLIESPCTRPYRPLLHRSELLLYLGRCHQWKRLQFQPTHCRAARPVCCVWACQLVGLVPSHILNEATCECHSILLDTSIKYQQLRSVLCVFPTHVHDWRDTFQSVSLHGGSVVPLGLLIQVMIDKIVKIVKCRKNYIHAN